MDEPRDLTQESLAAAVRRRYAINVAAMEFLAVGEDARAWVYRVDTEHASTKYVLKVRASTESNEAAFAVPRYLYESGVPHVVAPVRSTTQSLSVREGRFALTVYPFIEGSTGVDAGLSEQHWRALGCLVRQLHTSPLPSHLMEVLATEAYRPTEVELVRRVDRAVSAVTFADPSAREVAAFWKSHRRKIETLVERTEELGPQVEELSLPLVLCHADLHTWNVMIDRDGELWLVDWDEVIQAPKERDLMFFIDGIGADLIKPHETEWFFEGYGEVAVDPLALSYYRYAWAVQDVGGYGERVFLTPDIGEENRSHAARILLGLFDPDGTVELAFASDDATG
jgi:spectinomycin phosphotransferase